MLFWLVLFTIVLIISFILAFKSMADYHEKPVNFHANYALFLIRSPQNFTSEVLTKLHREVLKDRFILSLEKLFRGKQEALVVYGPKMLLLPFGEALKLLEIEDYSKTIEVKKPGGLEGMVAWEAGIKNASKILEAGQLFKELPKLEEREECWWQIVLQPTSQESVFNSLVRVVVKAGEKRRAQALREDSIKAGNSVGLSMLPQAYSHPQIVKFYQERALPSTPFGIFKKSNAFKLSSKEVMTLVGPSVYTVSSSSLS